MATQNQNQNNNQRKRDPVEQQLRNPAFSIEIIERDSKNEQ